MFKNMVIGYCPCNRLVFYINLTVILSGLMNIGNDEYIKVSDEVND